MVETVPTRSLNRSNPAQNKRTESLLQPLRIAFHRELNECYDQLVPVAYEARQKLSLTLLQRNGLFRLGDQVFGGLPYTAGRWNDIRLRVSTEQFETEHTFGFGEDQIGNG